LFFHLYKREGGWVSESIGAKSHEQNVAKQGKNIYLFICFLTAALKAKS
jgi:hypothetical protein